MSAVELGFLFHVGNLGAAFAKSNQKLLADIGMGHLTTAEAHSDLDAVAILEEHKDTLKFDRIEADDKVGKVSIVGVGLMSNAGIAAKVFEALFEAGINIQMISTSEIRLSVLLDENDVNRAVKAIHDKFFDEA